MSADGGEAREDVSSDPITVHVEHNVRGWQANDSCRVMCETLTVPAASRTCTLLTPAATS